LTHTCKQAKITSLGSIETMQNQMRITQIGLHVFEYSHCAQNLTLNMYTKLLQLATFECTCGLRQKPGQTADFRKPVRKPGQRPKKRTCPWKPGHMVTLDCVHRKLCNFYVSKQVSRVCSEQASESEVTKRPGGRS